jgi:hypothetical protein
LLHSPSRHDILLLGTNVLHPRLQIPKLRFPQVSEISTPRPPLRPIPGLGQRTLCPFHIRALQLQHRHLFHLPLLSFLEPRNRRARALFLHLLQQPADQLGRGVRAERPGSIHVADHERRVGEILHHDGLPDEFFVDMERLAVDGQFCAAGELDLETCRRGDDVWMQLLAVSQFDALLRHFLNHARDDACLARAQASVEVAVWTKAHALLEGVVARLEVWVVRDAWRQLVDGPLAQHAFGEVGEVDAESYEEVGDDKPLDADQLMGPGGGEDGADEDFEAVGRGLREDVTGGALQHGHVRDLFGEGGDEGYRRGTGADDDNGLVGVVEILGPELRVHDFPGEVLDARDHGGERLIVVVVAGAHKHKAALECLGRAVRVDGERPGLLGRRPVGGIDLVPELDFLVDAIHGSRLLDVFDD